MKFVGLLRVFLFWRGPKATDIDFDQPYREWWIDQAIRDFEKKLSEKVEK